MKLVVIVLLLVLISGYWSFDTQDPTKFNNQVIAIPSESQGELLEINGHLRVTPRPAETFDFPIALGEVGPHEPLYAGEKQYPFYCMTRDSRLGEPVVDNQQGLGGAVFNSDNRVIGYSKDCGLPSQLRYVSEDHQGKLQLHEQLPQNHSSLQSLFRVELGTINRFIYGIVMPIPLDSDGDRQNKQLWNGKLIYQFAGGSGIGFRQGKFKIMKLIKRRLPQLKLGYAVISSSGNRTSYTYNMLLAEDTANRVKRQFVGLYGEPSYTIGVGGSGGALAQYLIAQNGSGLLDAALPLYSYPDMVSQSIYALDCDLLNTYYDFRSANRGYWQEFANRVDVEGLYASDKVEQKAGFLTPINTLLDGKRPYFPSGSSECINGWLGLASYIHNPKQGFLKPMYSSAVVRQTHWSYWEDMAQLYGRDEQGYGKVTWDNEGVQYGLKALVAGDLSPELFLDLNRKIGSWKPATEMQRETLTKIPGSKLMLWLTQWSRHNVTSYHKQQAAQRARADLDAVEAAYRSGQVFLGHLDIPVLDVRHYLDHKLDMHHSSASFESRLRLQSVADNQGEQVIWIAHEDYTPIEKAFKVMDEWLMRWQSGDYASLKAAKPASLQDSCFGADGELLHAGKGVWDGEWNGKPQGACQARYPTYSNSRIQAGGPWIGSIFKCQLISVEQAIANGVYGNLEMQPLLSELQAVFPTGVCDYSQGDAARPGDL